MGPPLDIADLVRRTGLTARALRFYQARGLVALLRNASDVGGVWSADIALGC